MKRSIILAAAAAASFGVTGCATVMNGTSQPVSFRSDPDGAVIKLVTGPSCTTPCKFDMKRGSDSMATYSRAGYKPVEVYIQSRMGGSTFGNILAGGVIGAVVDGSNGASNHLYPNPVFVRLVPEGSTGEPMLLDKNGKEISTVAAYNAKVADDVLKGLEKQGLYAKGQAGNQIGSK
ncbi:hypothetical protein [Sphingomonas sp. LHG3406-1]|uniref:hypothetical protein n=1 Tax=Sphingomonas sp. LHG3406-1 TaxID=2804617 RepID=UPI0026264A86|nr:hypothetical protein [Sphingomonas sp. LHG3406-1]